MSFLDILLLSFLFLECEVFQTFHLYQSGLKFSGLIAGPPPARG